MRDSFLHRQANSPSRIPLYLAGLLLGGALLPAPLAATSPEILLKWGDPGVAWPDGSLGSQTFLMSNGVQATITVAKGSGTAGGFSNTNQPAGSTTISPLEDCGSPGNCDSNAFGSAHDLAVAFDPAPSAAFPAGQVTSPIIITMTFTDAVTHTPTALTNLKFEISDIDFSIGGSDSGQSHRRDEIVVTSDGEDPTLSFKTPGPHTFSISDNKATANCTGVEPTCSTADDTTVAPSDSGTVVVDFSGKSVKAVTITYNEAGTGNNPAFRGVGVFGELTPVELVSFTVD